MKKLVLFVTVTVVSFKLHSQNYNITSKSVGDVSYEMTIEEIQKSYPIDQVISGYEDDSLYITLLLHDKEGKPEMMIRGFNKPNSKMNKIVILSHMYKLQNGIGLGSTKGDLDAHFGRSLMFYGEGKDVVFSSDELGYIFTFHGRKEWRDNAGRLNPSLMEKQNPFNMFEILIY